MARAIKVTPRIILDESELEFRFVRASGPGGQNVNKVSTAVQLRFDVRATRALPEDVRARLTTLAGRRLSGHGILTIDARRFRTQERNRQDAIARLVALIQRATEVPKTRRKTAPSAGAKARRLDSKRRTGAVKRLRQSKPLLGE